MTISQTSVRARRLPGKVGLAYDLHAEEIDFTNAYPQAVQTSTVTVDTATDDTLYTFEVNGVSISYISGTGASLADIAAGLAAALNAEPAVRQSASADAAAAVVTIEGLIPGIPFVLTESDANLTAADVTAAAEATPIPFGRLCVRGAASGLDVYPNRLGRLPTSGDTDVDDIALGVSLLVYDQEGTEYAPNARVAAMKEGRVWVEVDTAVSESDDVYVGTGAGEEGKFYNASGPGRLKFSKSVCRFFKSRAEDGLAVLECNFH